MVIAATQETDDALLRQVLRALRERRRWPQIGEAARHVGGIPVMAQVTRVFESWLMQAAGSITPPLPTLPLCPLPLSA